MPKRKKKHAMEQTTDEAMERLFGKRVRDKLKEFVRENDKPDAYGKSRPIGELYRVLYPASKT